VNERDNNTLVESDNRKSTNKYLQDLDLVSGGNAYVLLTI